MKPEKPRTSARPQPRSTQQPRSAPAPKGGGLAVAGTVLGMIGKTMATCIMVGIITGCIVACIMTVYVLKYIGAEEQINLDSVMLGNTSIIYAANPKSGDIEEIQRLYRGGENRIWIDYDSINQYTKDAIVSVEDKRFWDHQGVDWRRTFGAFLGLLVPVEGTTTGGGSTITQQLIKNVTGDDDVRIERKVREIFRALDLSKRYSREQILEAYLNVAPFGNGTIGIQTAANIYFGKDAVDLTLAESAAIVGITQYPGYYDPFKNADNNKERQIHILKEMLEQGRITQAEHDAAVTEPLNFRLVEHQESLEVTQSYFIDYVIETVIADLIEQKGYTYTYASEQVYTGGYRIYTTVNTEIQEYLEDYYRDPERLSSVAPVYNAEYPQSAFVLLDGDGAIVALVGGTGEKEGARVLNRATGSKRHPGSSIKPLAAYALGFKLDRVTWSTIVEDGPLTLKQGNSTISWPSNYYAGYAGNMTVVTAFQRSTNTIPAKLVDAMTPRRVFDFLKNELNFYSLVESVVTESGIQSDVNHSAMALGGMTYGVTPLEMAGGYQMFINGGQFTSPYCYTRVTDAQGRTVLEAGNVTTRPLSTDTAVVINKLLQMVVSSAPGTGTRANLGIMPTGGKTGTSTNDVDQWFIGVTPYYVGAVWLGYDEKTPDNGYGQIRYGNYSPPILWRDIMLPLHEGLEYQNFYDSTSVVSRVYCTQSGMLATDSCGSRATGWYKASNVPGNCTGHAVAPTPDPATPSGGGTSSPQTSEPSRPPSIFDDPAFSN